jgi:hypothetical protein
VHDGGVAAVDVELDELDPDARKLEVKAILEDRGRQDQRADRRGP